MEQNSRKIIPILYERKEDCCGCTACLAICPKQAIEMVEDEEGFEYPKIVEEKCVRCGMCLKVCPVKESKNCGNNKSSGGVRPHKFFKQWWQEKIQSVRHAKQSIKRIT